MEFTYFISLVADGRAFYRFLLTLVVWSKMSLVYGTLRTNLWLSIILLSSWYEL